MAKTDRIEKWQYLPPNTVAASAASGAGGGASGDADKVDGFDASATALPNTLLALNASSKLPADIIGDADTVDGYDASAFLSPQYVVLALDGNLTAERVLTAGDGIDLTDGGAGGAATLAADLGTGLTFSSGEIVLAWAGTPDTIEPDDSASAGSSLYAAHADHQHAIACAAPGTNLSVSTTNTEGAATSFARSDHSHTITSSSNPGSAAALLASAADGGLQLVRLGIGVDPADDNYISLVDGAVVGCPAGPRIVFDDTNDYFEMMAGDVGIRTSTPAAAMDVHKDTEQLRLTYASDTAKYVAFTVGSTGSVEVAATTNIILDPGGQNVNPGGHIQDDFGAWNVMWRTGFMAELYVPNLVAQDVMATIGGRITVAPTTYLTADVASGGGSIEVEHNNLATNDFVVLMAAPSGTPQFECMQITGGPTGAGPYTYTVARNEDGSGANDWSEGDAVLNSGYSDNAGLIELAATSTIYNHLGPTMAIYNREGTSWDDMVPVVALGNLDSFLGYGTVYGLAMGNDLTEAAPTSASFKGATLDRSDGLRLFNTDLKLYDSSTPKVQIQHDEGILVSSGTWGTDTTVFAAVFANDGTVTDLDAGDVIIGRPFHATGSSQIGVHWDNSASALKIKRATLELYNGATQTVSIQPDGDVQIGSNVAAVGTTVFQIFAVAQTYDSESMGAGDILIGDHGNANMFWDESAGQLKFRDGTTTECYIDADGKFVAGGAWLDSDGINLDATESGYLASVSIDFIDDTLTWPIVGMLYTNSGLSEVRMNLVVDATEAGISENGADGILYVEVKGGENDDGTISLNTYGDDNQAHAFIDIESNGGTGLSEIRIGADTTIIPGGIYVGVTGTATDNDIRAAEDICAGGGGYFGDTAGEPATGVIHATAGMVIHTPVSPYYGFGIDMAAATGGWHRGFFFFNGTTRLGGFSVYGTSTPTISYYVIGDNYNDSTIRAYPTDGGAYSGFVSIGNMPPSAKLHVLGNASGGYAARFHNDGNNADRHGIEVWGGADNASGTTYYYMAKDGNGGIVGYLQNSSGVFSLVDASDESLKRDIVDSPINGREILDSVLVRDFYYQKQGIDAVLHTGFVAQELQAVWPRAVSVGEDGLLGVSRAEMIPPMVKSIQELSAEISRLQAEIEMLKKAA